MKILLTTALTSAFLLLGTAKAHALVLYNGSLGTSPNSQGWTRNFLTGPTVTVNSSGTTLNTTSNDSLVAGYGRTVTMDRNTGYNLMFRIQLNSENHDNPNAQNNTGTDTIADRAGLSVAVLSSTDARGIELGFWTNRIWAQEDGAVKADPVNAPTGTRFTQAEGVSFNTQAAAVQYDLSVLGNTYYLYAGGSYAAPILTGRLRDYTLEGFPYTSAGSIGIGDNTSSARGSFRLEQVELTNSAIVPVPFAFNPLFGFGLFGISRIRKAIKARQSAN
ncbi:MULTISPECIES: choice-of-anchor Y domain-containing protein [unclassified Leptolyngbya]|uniref:choice-of-anchor Y domain-containing protein n=1 Tax=unclassified Leptolyngbya TaxID=2650499 RepID=UPI001AD0EC73|nr:MULTISPECIES: hypothetical protein [unclassified Leptolyngbya]MBN8559154.1 hypothetical protein [Leptolyngbya sp. UWPOB_LEPTO1]MCY6489148.1 hypothetical protein [Leptolyngbya sp. GGD]